MFGVVVTARISQRDVPTKFRDSGETQNRMVTKPATDGSNEGLRMTEQRCLQSRHSGVADRKNRRVHGKNRVLMSCGRTSDSPKRPETSNAMKALIIDDSRTMRRLLSSYVSEFAIEAVEAEDGRHALDQLEKEGSVDFALVDWDMPVMNGLDFVKAVRADPRHDGMKLMMVTAHTAISDVGEALDHGADDFLMKPFDGPMVANKLRLLGLVE